MLRQVETVAVWDEPTGTEASDAILVAAAQRDRRAFAPLYIRYVDQVYGYCLRDSRPRNYRGRRRFS
jgi:hypothetical protein